MRRQLRDQVLEGPAVAKQPEVRQRAGWEQASQKVERLGASRRLPRTVGLAFLLGEALPNRGGRRLDEPAVGLEERVGSGFVLRVGELGSSVVEVAAVGSAAVEPYIASRFLERRDSDPAVLERLGGQRGGMLDRYMRAGELGDGVVAVADQDPLVELLRASHSDHVVIRRRRARKAVETGIWLIHELVEKHAAKALLGPRVTREERPLDDLRQVAEGEYRPVQVGEVAFEQAGLGGAELHTHILPAPPGDEGPDQGEG